jgi:hypothetical protein
MPRRIGQKFVMRTWKYPCNTVPSESMFVASVLVVIEFRVLSFGYHGAVVRALCVGKVVSFFCRGPYENRDDEEHRDKNDGALDVIGE